MDDILNAIEDLTEEARISGAHPDEPTNYKEAHAALLSLIRTLLTQERAAERERACVIIRQQDEARTIDLGGGRIMRLEALDADRVVSAIRALP